MVSMLHCHVDCDDGFIFEINIFFSKIAKVEKLLLPKQKYCYEHELTKKSTLNTSTVFARTNFYGFFMSYL